MTSLIEKAEMNNGIPKANLEQQGITEDRYKLIPRCLIFIRKDDSFLLLKGSSDKKIWANRYNGVGGHIERDEDVRTAAQRELLEETGLSTKLELKGILTVDPGGYIGVGIFVFTGDYTSGIIKQSVEGDLHWVEMKDMKDLPLVEDVRIILKHIKKMDEKSPPFFAHSYYGSDGRLKIEFN
ncbi:NUDIX domain-containing protein [Chloroflexota bacterium]